MATNVFRPVETTNANEALHRRNMAEAINRLGNAKHNGTGSITLGTGTSTMITDARIGSQTVIALMAQTANAANAQAMTPGIYVIGRADGTATLVHATATVTDRTYSYVIGG